MLGPPARAHRLVLLWLLLLARMRTSLGRPIACGRENQRSEEKRAHTTRDWGADALLSSAPLPPVAVAPDRASEQLTRRRRQSSDLPRRRQPAAQKPRQGARERHGPWSNSGGRQATHSPRSGAAAGGCVGPPVSDRYVTGVRRVRRAKSPSAAVLCRRRPPHATTSRSTNRQTTTWSDRQTGGPRQRRRPADAAAGRIESRGAKQRSFEDLLASSGAGWRAGLTIASLCRSLTRCSWSSLSRVRVSRPCSFPRARVLGSPL